MIRLRAEAPSTSYLLLLPSTYHLTPPSGTPSLLPIPLSTLSPPLLPPSTDLRADVREVFLPPRKRLCYTFSLRFEVGESSSAPTVRLAGDFMPDYGFIAILDDEIMRDPERDKMAPKRTTRAKLATTTYTTTTTVTNTQLKVLIEQGVNATLAARDVDRNTNGDDNHVSGISELELLYVRMFPEESDKIKRYVGGLLVMIHGSVVASKPKKMQEEIEMAIELMDKKIHPFAERSSEKKPYGGSKPLCTKCNYHHDGPCAPKCHKCNKVGHFACDCKSTTNANPANNQRGTRLVRNILTMNVEPKDISKRIAKSQRIKTVVLKVEMPPLQQKCMRGFNQSGLVLIFGRCAVLVSSKSEIFTSFGMDMNPMEEEEGLDRHGISFKTCLLRQGTCPCLPLSKAISKWSLKSYVNHLFDNFIDGLIDFVRDGESGRVVVVVSVVATVKGSGRGEAAGFRGEISMMGLDRGGTNVKVETREFYQCLIQPGLHQVHQSIPLGEGVSQKMVADVGCAEGPVDASSVAGVYLCNIIWSVVLFLFRVCRANSDCAACSSAAIAFPMPSTTRSGRVASAIGSRIARPPTCA
nr:reverse transcriptase domain-containing protein [Tanacetum cinerariifolium]